jgi:hypothetical protein
MRRVHVSLSFLLRLMALPDTSCMGRYDRTGVPRIMQSGRVCYVLACVELNRSALLYLQLYRGATVDYE